MIEDGRLLSEGASPDVGSVEVELQVTSLHNHTGTAGKLSSDNWVSGSDKTPWHSETSRIFIKKFLLKVFVRQSSKCDALPACNEITVKTNQFIPWECLSPTMYAGLYKDPRCPNLLSYFLRQTGLTLHQALTRPAKQSRGETGNYFSAPVRLL